jgi:hypothetical protein
MGPVDWIHLLQGKDQWQADVNAVMKLLAPLDKDFRN